MTTTAVPSRAIPANQRLLRLIEPLVFSGSRPGDTDDERLRKALLMGGSLLIAPVALVWGILYAIYREPLAAALTLLYAAFDTGGVIYLYRTGRRGPLAFVNWSFTLLLPFVLTMILGGLSQASALVLGALMAPLGALLYYERAEATRLFVAFVVLIGIISILHPTIQRENNLPQWLKLSFFALNVIIVSSLAFFQMRAFVRQRDNALRMLRAEQEKTDSLLCNILPRPIANILKDEQRIIAQRFEAVSVLFADVVGYTPLSTTVDADEMVILLNEIYTHFDNVVEKYALEKIRTMGDGYMVASGVPTPRADHAQALAAAALEMMAFLDDWDWPRASEIHFRMGISSGPVLAGVIGRKKFSYDVWGDPVNTASRMESHSVSGKIQVSRATYDLLKDEFVLEPRGAVAIKGKGELETWFLLGKR